MLNLESVRLPTSRSFRADQLRKFVEEEFSKFKAGEIGTLSSYVQLAERFGYTSADAAKAVLKYSGLTQERRQFLHKEFDSLISREGAWILGVLSSGGYVGLKTGEIIVGRAKEKVLNSFKLTGERLFNIPSTEGTKKYIDGDRRFVLVKSTQLARALGDLRLTEWSKTIVEKHPWIFRDSEYIWGFLEGFFELRGKVYIGGTNNKHHTIELLNTSLPGCNLLAELLTRVGISKPQIRHDRKVREEVRGVRITNLSDINLFAQNINSKISEKQEQLELLRFRRKQSGGQNKKWIYEDFINEWIRLTQELGHAPIKTTEINQLFREGKTQIGAKAYANRCGNGIWSAARENFERIVRERSSISVKEVNTHLQQYEHVTGKQIRFVPKIHRLPEEEAKKRLNQITGYTEQASIPQVLYGHDGETIIFPPEKIEDKNSTQRYTVDPVTKLIVLKEPEREKPTSQETQIFP